jgi:hypothetical protein
MDGAWIVLDEHSGVGVWIRDRKSFLLENGHVLFHGPLGLIEAILH